MVRGDLSKIDARVVGTAAQDGDPLALEIITRGGKMVGLGIVTLLHLFNPEVVVVGGGVTNVGDLLFNPMREAIEKYAIDSSYWENLQIKHAALGEDVSIFGAAVLAITRGGHVDVTRVRAQLHED